MAQNQRDPPAVAGPLVHEMNRVLADLRPVVRDTVQLPLGSPPIEPVSPVAEQLFQPVTVSALRPRRTTRPPAAGWRGSVPSDLFSLTKPRPPRTAGCEPARHRSCPLLRLAVDDKSPDPSPPVAPIRVRQIGRASCRE